MRARLWMSAAALLVAAGVGAFAAAHGGVLGGSPRGGVRAHVDPDTGRLTGPPAHARTDTARPRQQALDAGLVETPGTGRAGGVTVRLDDRHRTTLRATVEPDGHVSTRCED